MSIASEMLAHGAETLREIAGEPCVFRGKTYNWVISDPATVLPETSSLFVESDAVVYIPLSQIDAIPQRNETIYQQETGDTLLIISVNRAGLDYVCATKLFTK